MTVVGCEDLCKRDNLCVEENMGYLTRVCKEYLYKHNAIRYGLELRDVPVSPKGG